MRLTAAAITVLLCLATANAQRLPSCDHTSVGLTPLIDSQSLSPPPAHAAAGTVAALALARERRVVVGCLGMSNTRDECGAWIQQERRQTARNVRLINLARGGCTADSYLDSSSGCLRYARRRLAERRLRPADVDVLLVQLTNRGRNPDLSAWLHALTLDSRDALRDIADYFYRVKIVLLVSRTYGGYEGPPRADRPAGTGLNPEPQSYLQGLVSRYLIQRHLDGQFLPGVWLGWGPYQWGDGETPRAFDGLQWFCEDFGDDGVHPSPLGAAKAAGVWAAFFHSDPIQSIWYRP